MSEKITSVANEKGVAAVAVSDRVQLLSVRLVETGAQFNEFATNIERMKTGFETETRLDTEKKRLEVLPRFSLVIAGDGADDSKTPLLRIAAKFSLSYSVSSLEGLTTENYESFGAMNGVFNAWPYWREFVQSMSVRMGVPAITLPVFRVGMPKAVEFHLNDESNTDQTKKS